jgi:putative transposase
MERKGEAGLWQRRFWEHLIRDSDEERRAIAFCLSDPVRHGLADRPEDWPFSTIHRDLRSRVGGSPTLPAARSLAVA